jgi:dephospho-CoA kinase
VLLGLTGGYCAGKNVVAGLLEERGWTAIDVDRLGHRAVDLAREEITARFGNAILAPDGSVDRSALARIVFSNPTALADQEAIIHPIALRLLEEEIVASEKSARAAGRAPLVCVNAALLYRMPEASRCDAIIEVRAPLLLRLARARKRDGLSPLVVLTRIERQRVFWKLRRAHGKPLFMLRNNGDLGRLEGRLERILSELPLRRD